MMMVMTIMMLLLLLDGMGTGIVESGEREITLDDVSDLQCVCYGRHKL